jgi:hypothetical protein
MKGVPGIRGFRPDGSHWHDRLDCVSSKAGAGSGSGESRVVSLADERRTHRALAHWADPVDLVTHKDHQLASNLEGRVGLMPAPERAGRPLLSNVPAGGFQ